MYGIDKKGIRCKSGVVPAAVSLKVLFERMVTVLPQAEWEGLEKPGKPEDLPNFIKEKSKLSG